MYLAVVLDAWSRKIVGWAMATHLRTELVLDALNMALGQRRPDDELLPKVGDLRLIKQRSSPLPHSVP